MEVYLRSKALLPTYGECKMEKIKIELSEPLTTLAGQTLTELTADFSKIKTRDLALINRIAKRIKGEDLLSLGAGAFKKEADPDFRIAVTWVACMKGTAGLTMDDLDGLGLSDALDLGDHSLAFLVRISPQP